MRWFARGRLRLRLRLNLWPGLGLGLRLKTLGYLGVKLLRRDCGTSGEGGQTGWGRLRLNSDRLTGSE